MKKVGIFLGKHKNAKKNLISGYTTKNIKKRYKKNHTKKYINFFG